MKDLDNDFAQLLQAEEGTLFYLLEMDISDTITERYTSLDIDLYRGGVRFISKEFSIDDISMTAGTSVDRMKFKIADADQQMSALLLNNEVRGRAAKVYLGGLVNYEPVSVGVFWGVVSAWELQNDQADITITDEWIFWNKKTLRQQGEMCPWAFKENECLYSGTETECNKTPERCKELGQLNISFGGFRFVPAMEEKEIVWGRK
jgi:hypothetical protein